MIKRLSKNLKFSCKALVIGIEKWVNALEFSSVARHRPRLAGGRSFTWNARSAEEGNVKVNASDCATVIAIANAKLDDTMMDASSLRSDDEPRD